MQYKLVGPIAHCRGVKNFFHLAEGGKNFFHVVEGGGKTFFVPLKVIFNIFNSNTNKP